MMKSTFIASCISAMAMSSDLLDNFKEDIDVLQAQQKLTDQD